MRNIYLVKTNNFTDNQTISAIIVADSIDAIRYAMLDSISQNTIANVINELFNNETVVKYRDQFNIARQEGFWNCLNIPNLDAYNDYTIELLGTAIKDYDYYTLINEEICPLDSDF